MVCEHKAVRCTNNRFFCLMCGEEIPNPYTVKAEEKAVKSEKKPRKKKGE